MPHLPAPRPHRAAAAGITLALALALSACGDLVAALPPRPSPFPTLARLPSVTPVTPSPTRPPTATPVLPTATPAPLLVRAPGAANVRGGPGVDFAIVAVVAADDQIELLGRSGDWYQVGLADGSTGWMAGQVLGLDPEVAVDVPLVEP
jgi:uncharacterized protein YgiM (DUF1202 family)